MAPKSIFPLSGATTGGLEYYKFIYLEENMKTWSCKIIIIKNCYVHLALHSVSGYISIHNNIKIL